ncbi:MAG: hypothetical protein U1E42_09040 [Rhodospirillales bacterium]
MRIWRNLDPKLLADLLIQASESLKEQNAARRQRPVGERQPMMPMRSTADTVATADERHV